MAIRRDMIVAAEALADVEQHRIEEISGVLVLCNCKHYSRSLEEHHRHVLDALGERWMVRSSRRPNFSDEERAEMANTWNEGKPGLRTRAVAEKYDIPPRSVSAYMRRLEEQGYYIDRAGRGSGGAGQ
jgi:hypothetical protein